jgi:predicted DCC family thiol-disulfide oxidoreductase YuxK
MSPEMGAILLFDGVCNLCNAAVQFVLARDTKQYFRFASLQSEAGGRLLREHGIPIPEGDPSSMVVIEDGRAFERSSAALRIVRHLGWPWKLLYAFVVVPRFLRDAMYRFIANHRYAWFGKKDACLMPTPELRARFL